MLNKNEEAKLRNQVKSLQQRVAELEKESRKHDQSKIELQQLVDDLKQSEERFRRYFDLGLIGMITSTLEKNWLQVNDRVCEILGYSRDEMENMTWAEMTHPEDLAADVAKFDSVVKGETNGYSMDKRFIHKNGNIIYASISVTCVRNEDGSIDRFLAFVSDISERIQAQEKEAKLQNQLNQAQRMETVGRLAGGIAHDYNNMLATILGNTELALLRINSPNDLKRHLDEILKATKRSAEVTKQLLTFASKGMTLPKTLNLNTSISELFNMLRYLIGENIELAWEPCDSLSPIKFDPSQLDQILVNLCINARDSIEGVGKISIEMEELIFDEAFCDSHTEFLPGKYIVLSIIDNGSGISDEHLKNIFDPFFTTKEVGKGTGLGLATVHGAIKQNKGFITVDSELGKGSAFRLYFPPSLENIDENEKASTINNINGKGALILIVEDEPTVLEMTAEFLKKSHYKVCTASTSQEAIDLINEHKDEVSLLISDVIMPQINGRDLYKKLNEISPNLKCLFMSGYTSDVLTNKDFLATDLNFIQKPFQMNDLLEKVESILKA